MMISQSHAKSVWNLFREISNIPRPSKKEEKIIAWTEDFARKHNLACKKDSVGNLLLSTPASKGYESSPGVVLQAHLDMVCEKTPESTHNFDKDPIAWVEKDGWLYANNTTLGADNGIGMAMGLALLLEKDIAHPQLELLLTIDEETGLTGANNLQPGFFTGKILLNLDSEDEGIFTIGCAGGRQTDIAFNFETEAVSSEWQAMTLKVSELKGGHSGVNIIDQRANAIKLLTRTLLMLTEKHPVRLSQITGGSAHNAIPRDASAEIWLQRSDLEDSKQLIRAFTKELKTAFQKNDPNISIELLADATPQTFVLARKSQDQLLKLLLTLPHGVYRMSEDVVGLVETSSNLASIKMTSKQAHLVLSQRSSNPTCLDEISNILQTVGEMAHGEVTISGGYPPWHPNSNSPLLKKCTDLWKKKTGKEAKISIIHAGLECGVIGAKYAGLDMISLGPTVESPHSPKERLLVDSVDHMWEFVLLLVPELK